GVITDSHVVITGHVAAGTATHIGIPDVGRGGALSGQVTNGHGIVARTSRRSADGNGIRAAGDRVRAGGDGIRAAGDRVRAGGDGIRTAGDRVRADGDGIRAAGHSTLAAGNLVTRTRGDTNHVAGLVHAICI